MAIKQGDLIAKIAAAAGMTQVDVTKALKAQAEVAEQLAESGEDFSLVGIATVKLKDRPARTGRNPKTGDTVNIPARKAVVITASSLLKAAANR